MINEQQPNIDVAKLDYSLAYVTDMVNNDEYAEFSCSKKNYNIFKTLLNEFNPRHNSEKFISTSTGQEIRETDPLAKLLDLDYVIQLDIDKSNMNFLMYLLDKRIDDIRELELDLNLQEDIIDECYSD